jgi:hypothetical protein
VDLGTGDGRYVLGAARKDPAALVIGIDANASGLIEASRRAARPVSKGGLTCPAFSGQLLMVISCCELPVHPLIVDL